MRQSMWLRFLRISTLETDVCVWHYVPLVVHATQEEEALQLQSSSSPSQFFVYSKTIQLYDNCNFITHMLFYNIC